MENFFKRNMVRPLYNFTGNFTTTQSQTTQPSGLKEAMECHYGDCKCVKQENHQDSSAQTVPSLAVPFKPCSGKHCNCTCKTHKIVIAQKKEHAGKIHKCAHCDFTSKRSDNVRRHMLRHTGERPHKCPHCDFSAKRPHSIKKHIENIHSKDLNCESITMENLQTKNRTEEISLDAIQGKDVRGDSITLENLHDKSLHADGITMETIHTKELGTETIAMESMQSKDLSADGIVR